MPRDELVAYVENSKFGIHIQRNVRYLLSILFDKTTNFQCL